VQLSGSLSHADAEFGGSKRKPAVMACDQSWHLLVRYKPARLASSTVEILRCIDGELQLHARRRISNLVAPSCCAQYFRIDGASPQIFITMWR